MTVPHSPSSLNLYSLLSQRMDWLGKGMSLVTQNVSNMHTPSYRAQTMGKLDFRRCVRGNDPSRPVRTDPRHLEGSGSKSHFAVEDEGNVSESITGNTVSLDLELRKANEYGTYQKQLINIIQNNMDLLELASKVKEG